MIHIPPVGGMCGPSQLRFIGYGLFRTMSSIEDLSSWGFLDSPRTGKERLAQAYASPRHVRQYDPSLAFRHFGFSA